MQKNSEFNKAPAILLGLLVGGCFLFSINAFVGIGLFFAGLCYGFVEAIHSIATLVSAKRRWTNGLLAPLVTILIAVCAWTIVINETLIVFQSLQKRAEMEENATTTPLSDNNAEEPSVARIELEMLD